MKREERRLIAVASGMDTKALRANESLKLLNWGFRHTRIHIKFLKQMKLILISMLG